MIYLTFRKIAFNSITKTDITEYLTPKPQYLQKNEGSILFDENVRIRIEGQFETAKTLLNTGSGSTFADANVDPSWDFTQFAQKILYWLNFRLEELKSSFKFQNNQLKVEEKANDALPSLKEIPIDKIPRDRYYEAYFLSISDKGIDLIAWSMRGAYYGIVTLSQLLYFEKKGQILTLACPSVIIWDFPQYVGRGLVDDISRGQRPTMDNFKEFIRFLSRTKQNLYILYIEDIFRFKSFPRIGEGRGALTEQDIREIQAYAKEWFVTIVPGVELMGHMENIFMDPEYMQFAEFPGAQCIDVSNPKARDFIRQLIADIIPIFETSIFAPICDESSDFGMGNSREYVDKLGYAKALAEWYLFLIEEIKKYGKKVFFAHDIIIKFKEALRAVQKEDAMIYYWKYANKVKYPEITKLKKMGLNVAGGPGVFDWSRHFPYYDYAEVNMMEMGKDGVNRGLMGLVTTKWGDFFNENFRNNIFYGLLVNGQAAWSPFQSNIPQMRNAFGWHFYGTDDPRVLECIDLLSKQNMVLPGFPNGMYNRFWLDPFVRIIKPKEYLHAERFVREANQILKTLENLQKQNIIRLNVSNLDYLEFAARQIRHYGIKILVAEASLKNRLDLAKKAKELIGYSEEPILGGFQWLEKDITQLQSDYEKLWLRLAVKEGHEYPHQRFNILRWHYQQAIADLQVNRTPHSHQLESEWIWIGGKRLSAEWGNRRFFYFFKEFTLIQPKNQIKCAFIQGIAAIHMRIHINRQFIGEIISRQALSQLPMARAVQMYEILPHITEGQNMICIEAANWGAGIGGLNALLHIEYKDGSVQEVLSDTSWQYFSEKPTEWPFQQISQAIQYKAKNVRTFGKPPYGWQGPITVPVWEKGWKSSISFVFGNRNFVETAVPLFVGRKLFRWLFWLLPLGLRIATPEIFVYQRP